MSQLEKEYSSGTCKVRVSSYVSCDSFGWKTGQVIVYFDETNHCWKLRVETTTSKQAVYTIRLRDQISSVSLVMGRRLQVALVKNAAKVWAESVQNDSNSMTQLKALEFALKKIKEKGDPPRVLTKAPMEKQAVCYSADEVANIVSESSDDCFLFDEPSRVFDREKQELNTTPIVVRKPRSVPSRGEAMVNKSRAIMENIKKNKENRTDENTRAANFYHTDSRLTRSPLRLHSVSSNIRVTPKKIPDYSMRKPGLLSPPVSASRQTSTPLRQSTLSLTSPEFVGFSNLGNTCYMNAVLQSLLGLAPFYWDLVHNGSQYKQMMENGLYVSLLRLHHAKTKNLGNQTEFLKDVKRSISSNAKRFSGFEQHDAQEFFAQVLDQLNEEVQNESKKVGSDHMWLNPVVPNFELEVEHAIKCSKCDQVVNKTEQLYVLSVEVPGSYNDGSPGSIQSALNKFFSPEDIEYKCENCGHDKSTVYHEITKLPRIIVVHLKRWYHDVELQAFSKIAKPVFIPTFVTLLNHCSKETTRPRTPVNPSLTRILTRNAGKLSEETGVQQVPDQSSSPKSATMDRTDGVEVRLASPESDDELEKVMAMSRRAYEEEEKKRTVVNDDVLHTMDEDAQLKAAMELSLREAQPTPGGHLPDIESWGSSEKDALGRDTDNVTLPDSSTWIRRSHDKRRLEAEDDSLTVPSITPVKSVPDSKRKLNYKATNTVKAHSSSDIASSDSDNVPYSRSPSLTSDKSSDQRTSDYEYSPFRIKRRCEMVETPSSKSRRTFSGGDPGLVTEESEGHGATRSSEFSCRPMDQCGVTGLKGGWPLDLNEFENQGKCRNCGQSESNCACYEGDDEDLGVTTERRQAVKSPVPVEISSECICDIYQDKLKCLHCCKKSVIKNRIVTTPPQTMFSSSSIGKPPRTYERKFSRTDDLDWIVRKCEQMNEENLENESRTRKLDQYDYSFEADLEKATKLSLSAQTTEDDLLQQVLEQSKLEQSVRDLNEDEEMRIALEASRRDAVKTPVKETNLTSPSENRAKKINGDDPGKLEALDIDLASNAESGVMDYSYGLVSVVSHLGSSHFAGHYIADVYDPKKGWFSCNDSAVTKTKLSRVREEAKRSGYIFFFMAKEVCQDVQTQIISHPVPTSDKNSNRERGLGNVRARVLSRDSADGPRRFEFHRNYRR